MVRHKNRYVIVQINEKNSAGEKRLHLSAPALNKAILNKVQQLHGDFGVAAIRAGFTAKYCNADTRIAVIRIRHGPHRFVTSCLPLVKCVDEKDVDIFTLYTGATIRQCFKFLLNYQRSKLDSYCASLRTDDERTRMREALMNLDPLLTIN